MNLGSAPVSRRILVVDDEPSIGNLLARLLRQEGMTVVVAHDGRTALAALDAPPDLMLLDYRLPDMTGHEVLVQARARLPDLPVIIITAYADVPTAVKSIQAGAADYLSKPFDHGELIRLIDRMLKGHPATSAFGLVVESLESLMGRSPAVQHLITAVRRVAGTGFNVLILGETGTGKELVARAIHHFNLHGEGPFIAVDCGAVPESLLESEVFGHEKGAFTGAVARRSGKFEAANGGTLFLDEIANLSWSAQCSLLRVLQERVLYRVGGTEPIPVDVRIVAACNQDLLDAVTRGTFRQDLYYRLSEFTLRTPTLRERIEDIPFLVQRFLRETNAELCKTVRGLTPEAEGLLLTYDWPGNVRELRNVVRQATLLADDMLGAEHVRFERVAWRSARPAAPAPAPTAGSDEGNDLSLRDLVRRQREVLERDLLLRALDRTGGNKLRAAKLLSIDYKTLLTKLKDYGIAHHDEGPTP